jgi:hypothetical protein
MKGTARMEGSISQAPGVEHSTGEQEIEPIRERLSQTVEELAAKADVKAGADVKARARAKIAELKAKAQDQTT